MYALARDTARSIRPPYISMSKVTTPSGITHCLQNALKVKDEDLGKDDWTWQSR